VPYEGGMASLWGFRPRGLGLSARDSATYYAGRNGHSGEATRRLVTGTARRTPPSRRDLAPGAAPVTLFTVLQLIDNHLPLRGDVDSPEGEDGRWKNKRIAWVSWR
jgi:hypothetical protein